MECQADDIYPLVGRESAQLWSFISSKYGIVIILCVYGFMVMYYRRRWIGSRSISDDI